MNPTIDISSNQLRQAADIQERIEELQAELNTLLNGAAAPEAARATTAPRRKISAAGIARIRAAQKLRWAKARRATANNRPKRTMSAAAKARLAAIARARWRKARAAGRSRL